jgi:hypothetical protein
MEPESSLLCSQGHANDPYPKPDYSSPPQPISLRQNFNIVTY